MFSGIVSQRARVSEIRADGANPGAALVRVVVDLERALPGTAIGDSVAIDGVCLTVVGIEGRRLAFDAIPETLRKTTLGLRRPGDRVNVEAALRVGDPIGGHLVQGHVDGVGAVRAVERRGDDVRLVLSLPEGLLGATIAKGSVAVDGVSLTVGESEEDWFSVYLIPHTLSATGLGEKHVGDEANLEADVVGRYVEHHVRRLLPGVAGPRAGAGAVATGTKE